VRRIRYLVATSLDGYIAGPKGEAESEPRTRCGRFAVQPSDCTDPGQAKA